MSKAIDPKIVAAQKKALSLAKESQTGLSEILKEVDGEISEYKKLEPGFETLGKEKA